jgi:hypothetical protein
MKRSVLIFGTILGVILAGNAVYMVELMCSDPDFRSNDVLGYAAMVIVFSLAFFGIRNYRNKQPGGAITFGRAFKVGALIALLGSTIYVVIGLGHYYFFAPEFLDVYIRHVLDEAARDGATAAELVDKTKEMAQFKEMYANPFFAVLITYSEVLPIGLVVALVSALILKRKPQQVSDNAVMPA